MSTNCLILILDEKLEAIHVPSCPTSLRDGAGNLYTNSYPEDDNGFYDWLRRANGEIIGVRWFPYEDGALDNKNTRYLKSLKYIGLGNDLREIAIYFGDSREFEEQNSCDQDFLQNNLFISKAGKCAVSFSTANLSEKERTNLQHRR